MENARANDGLTEFAPAGFPTGALAIERIPQSAQEQRRRHYQNGDDETEN